MEGSGDNVGGLSSAISSMTTKAMEMSTIEYSKSQVSPWADEYIVNFIYLVVMIVLSGFHLISFKIL